MNTKVVPESEWTKDERTDWNVHRNIVGFTMIAFCASRFFPRLQKMGVADNLAARFEILFVLLVLVSAMWSTSARHKRMRHKVTWMTNGIWPFIVGAIVSIAYVFLLLFEMPV